MVIEINDNRRPIINAYIDDKMVTTLVDSGAIYSVYTKGINLLRAMCPGLVETQDVVLIGGFGSGKIMSPVYIIPRLVIGTISYYNVPIADCNKPDFPSEIVLASDILATTPFTINYSRHEFELNSTKSDVWCHYVTKQNKGDNLRYWSHTSVLAQEEINE